MTTPFPITAIREQFPALGRTVHDRPAVFLDGPAGSQVPGRVIDAMARYLSESNANCGGPFITSEETDTLLDNGRQAVADLVGAPGDADCIVFGANMTSLTFALSRSLARTWQTGDEVVVTRLDHDANVTPWVMAARDAGVTVRHISFDSQDGTLDLDQLRDVLGPRTRLLAVGAASNSLGTINPLAKICQLAHQFDCEVFVDAVHYAPHAAIDVAAWGCDYVVCSAYKFFGPHVGMLWGRRSRMAELPAYQVRPAGDQLPGRWNVGTQSHEAIAGTLAAIDYLADMGRRIAPEASAGSRRDALLAAYSAIGAYERDLIWHFLDGIKDMSSYTVWGIVDPKRADQRAPTVSFTHARLSPKEIARALGAQGIFVWYGNYYAIGVTEHLNLEPAGMVRIGLLHYNTRDEVDRLLAALRELDG